MQGFPFVGGCPLGWETKFQKGCMVVFCCEGDYIVMFVCKVL